MVRICRIAGGCDNVLTPEQYTLILPSNQDVLLTKGAH